MLAELQGYLIDPGALVRGVVVGWAVELLLLVDPPVDEDPECTRQRRREKGLDDVDETPRIRLHVEGEAARDRQ